MPHSDTYRRLFGTSLLLLAALMLGGMNAQAAINAFDQTQNHPAIPLLDEDGKHVLDTGKPYSSRMTCGNGDGAGCHDYEKITHAYHFEQGRDEADDAFGPKRGWQALLSRGYFGGWTCEGNNNPPRTAKKDNILESEFADYGAATQIKACGDCHAGGGWGEKDREGVRYLDKDPNTIKPLDGDYSDRQTFSVFNKIPGDIGGHNGAFNPTHVVRWDWKKSGPVEADCLLCHADWSNLKKFPGSQLGANNGSDKTALPAAQWQTLWYTKLKRSGYFRYAGSAIMEFMNIRPDTADGVQLLKFERSIVPKTTAPDYDLTLSDQGAPKITWNPAAFDANRKVTLPLHRFPASDNCMVCHNTSNNRRGFYGFGTDAMQTRDSSGVLVNDPKDDVHKGKTWHDDSGQTRDIENCNACHSKEYYKQGYANVNLSADHQFLKGNGDTDVRNDLDSAPPAKSCEYCHDTAKNPALPSGEKNVIAAHLKLWKNNGDMAGFSATSLEKITKTHMDTVACQTCHINNLVTTKGTPLQVEYRWRNGDDGKPKISPYHPSYRYYAQDKNSGRMIYQYERNVVFATKDGGGTPYGAIIDQETGAELSKAVLTVNATTGNKYTIPDTYDGWKAYKLALDSLLRKKGYSNPDVQFKWKDINSYLVTHNTRPSEQSVQCASCHTRKQSGAFSSLISDEGLLGKTTQYTVTKLPDRRLVDEGIIALGESHFKVDDTGLVTSTVADVLEASRINPSMSTMNAAIAKDAEGEWKHLENAEALKLAGVISGNEQSLVAGALGRSEMLVFNVPYGDPRIKAFALFAETSPLGTALLSNHQITADLKELSATDIQTAVSSLKARPASDSYSVKLADESKQVLSSFQGAKVLVKLAYNGSATDPSKVKVLGQEGGQWQDTGIRPLLVHRPETAGNVLTGVDNTVDQASGGYVIFEISKAFSGLAVADTIPDTSGGSNGSGGGITPNLPTPVNPAPAPAPAAAPVDNPASWASILPEGTCSTAKCKKSLRFARNLLRQKAYATLVAQRSAQVAHAKANKPGLTPAVKARLDRDAARKDALAQRAAALYAAYANRVRSLHD